MTTHSAALLAVLLLAACYKTNSNFDADARACETDSACTGTAAPICFDEACVQCTPEKATECKDATPICGDNNNCRACTAHAECAASKACLSSGACASATEVAYVASASAGGTVNSVCTQETPCTQISEALKLPRSIIKISGTISENVSLDGRNLTIIAEKDALLKGASPGAVLEVKNRSMVLIEGLQITEGLGNNGHGIQVSGDGNTVVKLRRVKLFKNSGLGLLATMGRVEMTQSYVSDNTSGGLSISTSSFDLTNNIIFRNGGAATTIGGVFLSQISTLGNIFQFNTVTGNIGNTNIITGVQCAAVAVMLTLSNSIVYNNNQNGGGGEQVGGANNCVWTYSTIGPVTVAGAGNIADNPQFMGAEDFQLMSSSPARDSADPGAKIDVDYNNTPRPQGLRADMGAIEIKQ